jgi:hypothetical protein
MLKIESLQNREIVKATCDRCADPTILDGPFAILCNECAVRLLVLLENAGIEFEFDCEEVEL